MVKIRRRIGSDGEPLSGGDPTVAATGATPLAEPPPETPTVPKPPRIRQRIPRASPLVLPNPSRLLSAIVTLDDYLREYPLGQILTLDELVRNWTIPFHARFFGFVGRQVRMWDASHEVLLQPNKRLVTPPTAIFRVPDLHHSLWPKVKLGDRQSLWKIRLINVIEERRIPVVE